MGAANLAAMPKYLTLEPHLTVDELHARYRACPDALERSRWHILWLLASGHRAKDVAAMVGFGADWVRTIAGRYNRDGPAAVVDGRERNPGQTPLLTAADEAELAALIAQPRADGQLWTGTLVAAWISSKVGRDVGYRSGWVYLRKLGFTLQRPRPRHQQTTEEAQAAFKKTPARR